MGNIFLFIYRFLFFGGEVKCKRVIVFSVNCHPELCIQGAPQSQKGVMTSVFTPLCHVAVISQTRSYRPPNDRLFGAPPLFAFRMYGTSRQTDALGDRVSPDARDSYSRRNFLLCSLQFLPHLVQAPFCSLSLLCLSRKTFTTQGDSTLFISIISLLYLT